MNWGKKKRIRRGWKRKIYKHWEGEYITGHRSREKGRLWNKRVTGANQEEQNQDN